MNTSNDDSIKHEARILARYKISHNGEKLIGEKVEAYIARILRILEKKPEFFTTTFIDQKTLLGKDQQLLKHTAERNLHSEQAVVHNVGHGTITIPDEIVKKKMENITSTLENSINPWIEYILSSDAQYGISAKYWIKEGLLAYNGRSKTTIAAFPVLDQQALAIVVDIFDTFNEIVNLEEQKGQIKGKTEDTKTRKDTIIHQIQDKSKQLKEAYAKLGLQESTVPSTQKKVLGAKDFTLLYSHALKSLPTSKESHFHITEGEWKKYERDAHGSHTSAEQIVTDIQDFRTGWCTAGLGTAQEHLQDGDFYVYYTKYDPSVGTVDEKDKNTAVIPRIAIRMEGNYIAEVKGVADGQEMDEYMIDTDILKEKIISEFGIETWKAYEKTDKDTKELTRIFKKYFTRKPKREKGEHGEVLYDFIWKNPEITSEEIDFLFSDISTFGYTVSDSQITKVLDGIIQHITHINPTLHKKIAHKTLSSPFFKNDAWKLFGALQDFTGIKEEEHKELAFAFIHEDLPYELMLCLSELTGLTKEDYKELVYEIVVKKGKTKFFQDPHFFNYLSHITGTTEKDLTEIALTLYQEQIWYKHLSEQYKNRYKR